MSSNEKESIEIHLKQYFSIQIQAIHFLDFCFHFILFFQLWGFIYCTQTTICFFWLKLIFLKVKKIF
jgi:hypothetical protein